MAGHAWHWNDVSLDWRESTAINISRSRLCGIISPKSRDCAHLIWYWMTLKNSTTTRQCWWVFRDATFSSRMTGGRCNPTHINVHNMHLPSPRCNPNARSALLHGGHGGDSVQMPVMNLPTIESHHMFSIAQFKTIFGCPKYCSFHSKRHFWNCWGLATTPSNSWDFAKVHEQSWWWSNAKAHWIGTPNLSTALMAWLQPPNPPLNISNVTMGLLSPMADGVYQDFFCSGITAACSCMTEIQSSSQSAPTSNTSMLLPADMSQIHFGILIWQFRIGSHPQSVSWIGLPKKDVPKWLVEIVAPLMFTTLPDIDKISSKCIPTVKFLWHWQRDCTGENTWRMSQIFVLLAGSKSSMARVRLEPSNQWTALTAGRSRADRAGIILHQPRFP